MLGIEGYKHYMELKSSCLKQCKNKGSLLDVKTQKAKLLHELGDIQMDIMLTVSPESIVDTGKSLSEALLFAEHVVYKNCSECQKQFLYTTCSPQV